MAQPNAPPAAAMRRGIGAGLVVVLMIVSLLAGVGIGRYLLAPSTTPGPPARLIVGTNTPFPPFESRNATTDNIEGFDIALITEVLNRSGYQGKQDLYDFRDFSALLAAVGAGRVDVAASALTMNGDIGAQRNTTMTFTNSYYESDQGILKKKSDSTVYCADTNNCLATELNLTTLRVAVQLGTSSEFWVEDNLPAVQLSTYPDVTQELQALQTNAVDVIIIDHPAAVGIEAANPNQYAIAGTIQTNELFAFAVPHGDPWGLIPKMNAALAAMISDQTYQRLRDYWF